MTCDLCGFSFLGTHCVPCGLRAAQCESRRAGLRARLDRVPPQTMCLASTNSFCACMRLIGHDGRCSPYAERAVPWRDFGEPIGRSARVGPDDVKGAKACGCPQCSRKGDSRPPTNGTHHAWLEKL